MWPASKGEDCSGVGAAAWMEGRQHCIGNLCWCGSASLYVCLHCIGCSADVGETSNAQQAWSGLAAEGVTVRAACLHPACSCGSVFQLACQHHSCYYSRVVATEEAKMIVSLAAEHVTCSERMLSAISVCTDSPSCCCCRRCCAVLCLQPWACPSVWTMLTTKPMTPRWRATHMLC